MTQTHRRRRRGRQIPLLVPITEETDHGVFNHRAPLPGSIPTPPPGGDWLVTGTCTCSTCKRLRRESFERLTPRPPSLEVGAPHPPHYPRPDRVSELTESSGTVAQTLDLWMTPHKRSTTLWIGGVRVTQDSPYIAILTPVIEEGWRFSRKQWPDDEEDPPPAIEIIREFVSAWHQLYN